jgi:protocatechuate 3,4-dioxygenase beta subunit
MLPVANQAVTPGLLLGPFYPVQKPRGAGHLLWQGQELPVGARVLGFDGHVHTVEHKPVVGALVELWHADPAGRYPHPSAPEPERVDPSFLGYGRVHTDEGGRFEFSSLVPGAYEVAGALRAVHLHVQITGRWDQLLTQIFLPRDTTRFQDRWFAAAARPEMLVANVLSDDAHALRLEWNAVVGRG